MPHAFTHNGYLLSDDPALIDAAAWHAYLARSYWAAGMPRERLDKALANSLCIGVYAPAPSPHAPRPMIGAGRAITDRATYAYLSDVYILEDHRGRGLSKAMMTAFLSHPDLQDLRRFSLFTRDAHALYAQFGFAPCDRPGWYMERKGPGACGAGQPTPA